MYIIITLLALIGLSQSRIITDVAGDNYVYEPPVIDLSTNDPSNTTLYVRLCGWSVMNGTFTIVNMTRYCYCTQPYHEDHDNATCSVPGPTLRMHSDRLIHVTVVNELNGSSMVYGPEYTEEWNKYKDMDTTNLHVHGLHVSPLIDNVLVKIPPDTATESSHSYPYRVHFHYPGTFWYHAHHHVCQSSYNL